MLMTHDASCLCPDCRCIRTPRSRHCHLCNRCVDTFDHHCPWINNCVGSGNHVAFCCFLTLQILFIGSLIYLIVKSIQFKIDSNVELDFNNTTLVTLISLFLVAMFFMGSLLKLCYY